MKTARNLLLALIAVAACAFAADPRLVNLVMPDAKVVSGINIQNAKATPLGMLVLAQMQKDQNGLQELTAATSFDPRNDIQELLLASADPQQQHSKGLVLILGNFDIERIVAAVKAKGGAAVSKNRDIYVLQSVKSTDQVSVAFLDRSIAVVGDAANVSAAIDRSRAKASSVDPALASRIQQLSNRYDAWFHCAIPGSNFPGKASLPGLGGDTKTEFLQAIQQTSGGVTFGSDVTIEGQALMKTPQDAEALKNVVLLLVNLVQMNSDKPGAQDAARIFQGLKVDASGATTTLNLKVPQADIEKLILDGQKPKAAAKKTAKI